MVKQSRRILVMNEIQDHFKCTESYYKEIQRRNVIIIFPGGVGLPRSMDTRGKQMEIQLKCWLINFKQSLSDSFMFNDTTVWYTNMQTNTHTHRDRNMDDGGMFFPFSLPARSQGTWGTWGTRDSECLNLHCLRDSGTKIMAFQCEGRRLFKAPEFGRSAQICVESGQPLQIYWQSLCPVPIVNFMRCRTSCFQAVADSKSSSIQCAMLCIVSHKISTALPTQNVKRLFAILNTKLILLPELQYQGLLQKEGLYPGSPGHTQLWKQHRAYTRTTLHLILKKPRNATRFASPECHVYGAIDEDSLVVRRESALLFLRKVQNRMASSAYFWPVHRRQDAGNLRYDCDLWHFSSKRKGFLEPGVRWKSFPE